MSGGQQTELKSFANDDDDDTLDVRADIDRAATIMRCTRLLIHQHAIVFNRACFAITNSKYKNKYKYTDTNTNTHLAIAPTSHRVQPFFAISVHQDSFLLGKS